MGKLLAVVLALILGFFGATVLSFTRGLTAPSNVQMEMTISSNSIASKLANNSLDEPTKIRMEILEPDIVLSIPDEPSISNRINIGVKNIEGIISTRPPITLGFKDFVGLLPELVAPDGKVLERNQSPDVTVMKNSHCFSGLGTFRHFYIYSTISWDNNKLKLTFQDLISAASWYFNNLNPGTYKLRFIYENCLHKPSFCLTSPVRKENGIVEKFGTGKCATQFANLNILIQP